MVFAFAGVAGVMVLRGALEYVRTVLAHETAARVQMGLRRRLFDKVVALGPVYFGFERTGDVITTLVDGVEHLETYFGQYIPQLVVSALTPVGIFALVAFLDLPAASVLAGFALFTLFAPMVFQGLGPGGLGAAPAGLFGVRGRFPGFGPGPGDAQIVRPERGPRAHPGRARARAVPLHHVGACQQLRVPGNHRFRYRHRRRGDPGIGGLARERGPHEHRGAAGHPDAGDRGLPAASRFSA